MFSSDGFVYTLKCPSLVLVLGVYMRTVGRELLSLSYMQQYAADRHVDLLATYVTLPLSSCQSACLHFVSDVYPPSHVDNQYNALSFNQLVGWLW